MYKGVPEATRIPDQWQTKTALFHVTLLFCFCIVLSHSLSFKFELLSLSLSITRKPLSIFLRRSLSDRLGMSTGDLLSIEPQELQFPCKLYQIQIFYFFFLLSLFCFYKVENLFFFCFQIRAFVFCVSNCFLFFFSFFLFSWTKIIIIIITKSSRGSRSRALCNCSIRPITMWLSRYYTNTTS